MSRWDLDFEEERTRSVLSRFVDVSRSVYLDWNRAVLNGKASNLAGTIHRSRFEDIGAELSPREKSSSAPSCGIHLESCSAPDYGVHWGANWANERRDFVF